MLQFLFFFFFKSPLNVTINLSSFRVCVLLLPFSVTACVPDPIHCRVEEKDTSCLFFRWNKCGVPFLQCETVFET